METSQFVGAASPQEEALIREIAATKDGLIKLIPEFRSEAEELRTKLRPHKADAVTYPDRYSPEERQVAKRDAVHNVGLARPFASRWTLPWMPSLNVDHSYLIDCPFSGAPFLCGTWDAVTEWGKERLPLLVLHVDVRFSKKLLLQRIDDRLDHARETWKSAGGVCVPDPKRELSRYKMMLAVVQRRDRLTQEEVAEELDISPRYVQALESDWAKMSAERKVAEIAPYTHMNWREQIQRAGIQHLLDTSREGAPFRIRVD